MNLGKFMVAGLLVTILGGLGGCGSIDRDAPTPPPPSPPVRSKDGEVPLKGSVPIGSQCPYGSIVTPQDVPLELWSCPLGLSEVELTQPLQPMILQADCKKRTLDLRGALHSLKATTWEVMPDGSFFFAVDAGPAQLKKDGAGNTNCTVPTIANVWGQLTGTDPR